MDYRKHKRSSPDIVDISFPEFWTLWSQFIQSWVFDISCFLKKDASQSFVFTCSSVIVGRWKRTVLYVVFLQTGMFLLGRQALTGFRKSTNFPIWESQNLRLIRAPLQGACCGRSLVLQSVEGMLSDSHRCLQVLQRAPGSFVSHHRCWASFAAMHLIFGHPCLPQWLFYCCD